ncbi:MAG: DNA/RNA non-specific endonuclease [Candidatus Latescibacterota bacterium]
MPAFRVRPARGVLLFLALLAAAVLVVLLEPDLREWLQERPRVPRGEYRHDRFGTRPAEHLRSFEAFVSSLDGIDDDDGDGRPDTLRVPQWVAYELRRETGPLPSQPRPSRWSTDAGLAALGVAPTDDSYTYPRAFRAARPDWYVRGHLAARYHAQRLGSRAADATQTLLNAVPQRDRLNGGAWLDLECLTGAWANEYGAVWIVTGPVFAAGGPQAYLGEEDRGEKRVAIPDALFKVVVRQPDGDGLPDVLGFLYPQDSPEVAGGPCRQERFLASVDSIETLTSLDLLAALPEAAQRGLESDRPQRLWPVAAASFDPACQRTRQCAGPGL